MDKTKISKLSLEELILLENKVDFNIFCTYIQNYLDNRFDKKEALSDNEIQQLNSLVQSIKLNNNVSLILKNRIYENIIKLIVFSKNIDNQNFINRISDLKSLSLDELYLYLETTLKYSSFCLTKEYLRIIVNLFKNDYVYLKKIKKLLNDSKIDKITKSTMNKVSLLLLFENNEDEFANISISLFNCSDEQLPFKSEKNIITIDKSISPDLDGAFSVEKKDDLYFLEVYVTDVPSFLLLNENLLKHAFDKSTSMYNHQNSDKLLIRDMLPPSISHNYLSLKKNEFRNVITFSYCIDNAGNVYLQGISRNLVFINDNVDPQIAKDMILSDSNHNKTQEDLKLYRHLCELICQNSKERLLGKLNPLSVNDIIGVPSILTNYHVGQNSKLAIYREHGVYTKSSEEHYTHSVTPLRRFVSNINLIAYLNQLGIINCPDRYIYYVEDNIDYIIDHLNEQEKMSQYFEKSYRLIKKYYK